MSEFITGLGNIISLVWNWLCQTQIPGLSFSFGALFIFLLVLDLGIFIFRIVFSGNTGGGGQGVGQAVKDHAWSNRRKIGF